MRKWISLLAGVLIALISSVAAAQLAGPDKPRSAVIQAEGDYGGWTYGEFSFRPTSSGSATFELERPTIYITRSDVNDPRAKELGIKAGAAYLLVQDGGTFKFLQDIDVSKSDQELCAQFGVEPKRGLRVTYVIPRQ
jgi:hypothetical protein